MEHVILLGEVFALSRAEENEKLAYEIKAYLVGKGITDNCLIFFNGNVIDIESECLRYGDVFDYFEHVEEDSVSLAIRDNLHLGNELRGQLEEDLIALADRYGRTYKFGMFGSMSFH